MNGQCKACGAEGHDRRSCPKLVQERRAARAREVEEYHDARDRERHAGERIADALDALPRDRWKAALMIGLAAAQRRIVDAIGLDMTRDRIAASHDLDVVDLGGHVGGPRVKA